MTVAVVAGGVGAARLLGGLVQVVDPASITAVVNTGDDVELHGLHISPDLDTITYTLAGAVNPETGWGLIGETWQAMEAVGRYGGVTWFNLGDRDLGTHLFRTQRLREGAGLTEVTAEIVAGWGLGLHVVPMSDDPVRTMITVVDEGEIGFQDYFVRRHHDVVATDIRFAGASTARPSPQALAALATAERVVIAPSNPLVSIAPVLSVPGLRDAVEARRADCVAVSPIIAGTTVKGPADRLLTELGHDASVVGVARLYAPLAARLVIDEADADLADAVTAEGIEAVVAPSMMYGPPEAAALARVVVS
ncbi:MAG TPA: 2-phospho-L-lactate transferase [Acidimicrobiales bacterium]